MRSWGRVGQEAVRGGTPTPSPGAASSAESRSGERAERDRPQARQMALFIVGALNRAKLEGAFLVSCPRRFSPPAFLYGHESGARHRESFVCPPGLVRVVRRLPAGPGSKTLCPSAAGGRCVRPGSGCLPPPQAVGLTRSRLGGLSGGKCPCVFEKAGFCF